MANQTFNLKSDHGKFACAEEGGGEQGQIIDGRPAGLMTATRDHAGAWETFTLVESDNPNEYGIQSAHGKFACCENEGKDGIIVFRSDSLGAWEKFILHFNEEDHAKVSFESVCRPGFFIKAWPDDRVSLDQPMFEGQPSTTPGGYETFVSDPPISSGSGVAALIQGQLRITEGGWADDSGPILPVGIHLGDIFSKFTRDPAHAEQLVKLARENGYPYIHFWMNLGTLGGDYWVGRECGPHCTPDFWGQLSRFGDLLDKYGIKGGYNLGDYALWGGTHADFFRELGRHLRDRENQTAAYVFGGNEAWQTGATSKEEISDALEEFKAECNTVPVTTTSPPTESTEEIHKWCGGDFFAIHGYRDGEDHDRIRHIFSIDWEGQPPSKYGVQDEPTGPGDEVSVKANHCYHGRDVDRNHMCALAVQSLLTNQGFNYFCSEGVKSDSIDKLQQRAGFHEVGKVSRIVPIDIMAWPKPFHFGSSQSGHRVFSPVRGDTLRFDHRVSHDGRLFGLFYSDQGETIAKCERACFLSFVNWDGTVGPEKQYDLGQELRITWVRSQNGEPGYTAQAITGRLR